MHSRIHSRWFSTLTGATVFGAGLLLCDVALAGNYTACFDLEVQNSDSNATPTGGVMEDYYLTSSPTMVDAKGVYVRVYDANGGMELAYGYSNSTTGCFTFFVSGSANLTVDLEVKTLARHGTTDLRAHDGGSTGNTAFPGTPYVLPFANKVMVAGGTSNLILPGGETWNAFMTGSYALARVTTGLAGKTINMGFDGQMSSASFSGAPDWVEDDSYLIRINNGTGSGSDSRRKKFEVVHEMGHAAARLNYGYNGLENWIDTGYDYSAIDFDGCELDNGYGQRSVEYDVIAFKEGFANMYAARVFNDRADDGTLSLTGTTYSLERFQDAALGSPKGGHLWNHCYEGVNDPGPEHGLSTIEDWTRFLWDVYTIPIAQCGSPQLGLDEMYDLYIGTRNGNPQESYTYHGEMIDAINGLGSLSACETSQSLGFLDWNAAGGIYHGF